MIANLQHLAVPQARGRLRKGLHAGGKFDKARVVSGSSAEDKKPQTKLLGVPLHIVRQVFRRQRDVHGGKDLDGTTRQRFANGAARAWFPLAPLIPAKARIQN